MNKKIITAALLFTGCFINTDIYAEPGLYAEANGGFGYNNHNGFFHGDNKFAYSGDLGYQFNANFGLELGYAHFSDRKSVIYSSTLNNLALPTGAYNYYNNYFTDLALKGSLPVTEKWNLFGKLGIAYTHQQQHFYNSDVDGGNFNTINTAYHVSPYLAGGVSYQLNSSFDINAQIQGTPTGSKQTDMVAGLLGVTYHFNG